jgi:hypothetical protein
MIVAEELVEWYLNSGEKSTCDNSVPVPHFPPLIQHGLDYWLNHCLVYSTHSDTVFALSVVSIVIPIICIFKPCLVCTKTTRTIGFVDVR